MIGADHVAGEVHIVKAPAARARVAELGHRVTVVDPSPDALAILARRAEERGVADRVAGDLKISRRQVYQAYLALKDQGRVG